MTEESRGGILFFHVIVGLDPTIQKKTSGFPLSRE
jgi:hypothetical protein